ncbi:OmpA family protein [Massilia sp. DWR3-1-1]|uniref:OmpA family protein n=1 Tax=Massilia sp. DWR3-1-1 TaxID=2804559 RepID=UPI003CF50826
MKKRLMMVLLLLGAGACLAQTAPAPAPTPAPPPASAPVAVAGTGAPPATGGAPVIVSGMLADEPSRQALVARLRQVFGAARVVDQLTVGPVAASREWNDALGQLIVPNLKLVSHGQLKVDGASATLRGDVASDVQRQQIGAQLSGVADGAGITVNNGLRVVASEQSVLDAALANRIIEFESGKATLTDSGKAILDQMSVALLALKDKKVEVIGHTDNAGARASNLALSQARAEAVRGYVAAKGVKAELIAVSGEGPDRPVADNRSAEGRARNRRIEFKVVQ